MVPLWRLSVCRSVSVSLYLLLGMSVSLSVSLSLHRQRQLRWCLGSVSVVSSSIRANRRLMEEMTARKCT